MRTLRKVISKPTKIIKVRVGMRRVTKAANGAASAPPIASPATGAQILADTDCKEERDRCCKCNEELDCIGRTDREAWVIAARHQGGSDNRTPTPTANRVQKSASQAEGDQPGRHHLGNNRLKSFPKDKKSHDQEVDRNNRLDDVGWDVYQKIGANDCTNHARQDQLEKQAAVNIAQAPMGQPRDGCCETLSKVNAGRLPGQEKLQMKARDWSR